MKLETEEYSFRAVFKAFKESSTGMHGLDRLQFWFQSDASCDIIGRGWQSKEGGEKERESRLSPVLILEIVQEMLINGMEDKITRYRLSGMTDVDVLKILTGLLFVR